MGGDICENCFRNSPKRKNFYIRRRTEPIIFEPNTRRAITQISKLRDNLTGVTRENSLNPPKSDSSKTSDWDNFNPEHFEINIRCGDKVTKFKVKKKYTVSKVITKFIEYEKPEKIEGKLLHEGIPLNATDIIRELDILDNETLDLI